jgi:cytochrome P450
MLMTDRYAREDADIGGVRIAAGDRVACVLHAANNDPEVFEQPERFDLGRTPNQHLAFGVGPHFCVGANLARLEAEVVIKVLAQRTPHMHLTGAAPRIGNQIMRGFAHLPVRARPRIRRAAPLSAAPDEPAPGATRTRHPSTLLTDRDPDIRRARPIDNH